MAKIVKQIVYENDDLNILATIDNAPDFWAYRNLIISAMRDKDPSFALYLETITDIYEFYNINRQQILEKFGLAELIEPGEV